MDIKRYQSFKIKLEAFPGYVLRYIGMFFNLKSAFPKVLWVENTAVFKLVSSSKTFNRLVTGGYNSKGKAWSINSFFNLELTLESD